MQGAAGVTIANDNLEFKVEDLPGNKQRELETYVYKCLNLPIPKRRPPPRALQKKPEFAPNQ